MRNMTVGRILSDISEVAFFIKDTIEVYSGQRPSKEKLIEMVDDEFTSRLYWAGTPGGMHNSFKKELLRLDVDEFEIDYAIRQCSELINPILQDCHDAIDDFNDANPDREDYRIFLECESMTNFDVVVRLALIEEPVLDYCVADVEAWDD